MKIGTCSWNYESWVGLVYSTKCSRSADYLAEYSRRFRTVEIDSWFYRIPNPHDVAEYMAKVDQDFTFAGKVTQNILLTHLRNLKKKPRQDTFPTPDKPEQTLVPNPDFFSVEIFSRFLESIRPMLPRIDALELEFEYLNRDKMPSLGVFLKHLDTFISGIKTGLLLADSDGLPQADGTGLPLAVETRNKNYLQREYFEFLKDKKIAHVFSEKQFLPHIYDVYERFGDLLGNRAVIRLLGGDRAAIEKTTGNRWDRIVEPKNDLSLVADMIRDLTTRGINTFVYVNNHYEGSAPLTIKKLENLLV